MALINCPECGKEISDTISQCIHCGFRLKKAAAPIEESKETGIKPICLRGGPSGIGAFIAFNSIVGLISLITAIVFLIISLNVKELSGLIGLAIVLGVISLLLLPAGIRDIVRYVKNSKIKEPCIKYDYDSDKVIIYSIASEEIVVPIEQYFGLSRSFWSTSNLLLFVFEDETGKKRYINLGYPLTNIKEVRYILEKLKNKKLSRV